ncbi:MAG TPA: aldehyde-activating protein [Gammaproteobacteria bacterium]|nr:aldehyde-activating protein [Gammaproteobacteria bacterium]
MASALHEYVGGCHCGAIAFSYRTALEVRNWSVRACQCNFCRAHCARTTSDPGGTITFSVCEPELLTRYRFGQGVTDFLICSRCGVYVGATIATDTGTYGIVNLNALKSVPAGIPVPEPMHYDGESKQERLSRREQRWSRAVFVT